MSKNNMNMNKRSQASLRVKTIQSEMDSNDINPWMNVQQSKNKSKLMRNIAASMVQEGNKQNSSINLASYQSVKQFSEQSIIQHQTPSTHKTPLMPPSEVTRSAMLRQSLIFDRINQSKSKQNPAGKFNYVQQYYQIQIDKLNNKILDMNKELTKYRQLYSSKQSELEDLNEGLSQRITKENCEKNVLIKEINSNNIEIKRLKEELNLQKSEKETLKIVLKQKQIAIEELNDSIIQTQSNRKKIQGYQMQLREHQATLQEIQMQTNMLKVENEKKDNVIAVCNKRITNLQSRLTLYQEQIKVLENQVLAFKQQSNTNKNRIEAAEKQCQQWKNKYCDVKLELEQIPELQMKLKNSLLMLDDLQARTKQLSMVNQKLKIQSGNYQNIRLKMIQYEKENGQLRKQYRQKVQQLEGFLNSNKISSQLQQELDYNRNRISLMEREVQEKDQEIRLSKVKLEERDSKISSLYEELQAISKESNRIKQLKSKINTLFVQNEKLHQCLREKIRQIEELQRKNNVLESKNITSNNQCIKLKSINEKLTEELTETESKLENMKNRWQTELGSKIMLEERCTRLNKDVAGLKSQIVSLEENNTILYDQAQSIAVEFEQKKIELQFQLDNAKAQMTQCQRQLQSSNKKIEELRINIKELKNEIDHQIQAETNHLLNINKLEIKISQQQQELKRLGQISEKQRKLWVQVHQASTNALNDYR